jgi:putative membrane protein insertion efficiency factor
MAIIILKILSFYRKAVSPYLGNRCRYVPSCSEYMRDAILRDGVLKGGWAGLRRFSRCAPGFKSGWDPY